MEMPAARPLLLKASAALNPTYRIRNLPHRYIFIHNTLYQISYLLLDHTAVKFFTLFIFILQQTILLFNIMFFFRLFCFTTVWINIGHGLFFPT